MSENNFLSLNTPTMAEKISLAQDILIVFASQATLDQAGLATTLYLSLKKQNKNACLFCHGEARVQHSSLVGINKAIDKLPQTGLIITMKNDEGQIGNISCDNQFSDKEVRIYIQANRGAQAPNSQDIMFSPLMATFDLIVVVGEDIRAQDLALIGLSADDEQKIVVWGEKPLFEAGGFYAVNSSYALSFLPLCQINNWLVDADMATNLLMGIDEKTQNLAQIETPPEVFEGVATLLRCGGKRYLPVVKKRLQQKKYPAEAIPKLSSLTSEQMNVDKIRAENLIKAERKQQLDETIKHDWQDKRNLMEVITGNDFQKNNNERGKENNDRNQRASYRQNQNRKKHYR